MISKNKIKFINSLSRKKERDETSLFIAEGEKLIAELLKANFKFETIISTNSTPLPSIDKSCEFCTATEDEMKKISLLKTPSSILAVVQQPKNDPLLAPLPNDLIIVLDNIQDPGNMGTIIRLASWFGIENIVCSPDCVECYNPKVVQASMGGIAHVRMTYTKLPEIINQALKEQRAVYGTFLEGENIYTSNLERNGIIVLGNEGKGISNEVEKLVSNKINIPFWGKKNKNIESLNVSVAASIVCSEFRRRTYK